MRPTKYKTEEERKQARREYFRRVNKKKYDKLRKENNPVVYKLVNKLDETFYIGSTKCLPIRLMAHPLLIFNRENWDIEVLYENEDEQLVRAMEISYIKRYAGNKHLLNKELYEK